MSIRIGQIVNEGRTAHTNLFEPHLIPSPLNPVRFRVTFAFGAPAGLIVVRNTPGLSEDTAYAKDGSPYPAMTEHTYTHEVSSAQHINYRISDSVEIKWLYVTEIKGE